MKSKHITKEYLLKAIKITANGIRICKTMIQMYSINIKKEKLKLNNTYYSTTNLWIYRDNLKRAESDLIYNKKRLKELSKLLSNFK